jgi:flagellar export protein FliJ
MPTFRFRLAPVLRLRERQREAQRLAFAAVEEERLRLQEELQRFETRLAAYAQETFQADGRVLTATDFQLYSAFVQQLDLKIQQKRATLVNVEARREEQRLALLEADTGVKSLEQFKARLEERHYQAELAAAQQQADEVGQHKYVARQQAHEKSETPSPRACK